MAPRLILANTTKTSHIRFTFSLGRISTRGIFNHSCYKDKIFFSINEFFREEFHPIYITKIKTPHTTHQIHSQRKAFPDNFNLSIAFESSSKPSEVLPDQPSPPRAITLILQPRRLKSKAQLRHKTKKKKSGLEYYNFTI